ncbi:MAG: hypothetical protein RML45_00905 [Acetobacteraceae bacterium]|nr:hypothetical protein [Acetobacteraceae bacterium]
MPSLRLALVAATALAAAPAIASPFSISGSVGGAPTGVVRDNFDWILPQFAPQSGTVSALSPQSGITVTLVGGSSATANDRAGAVTGAVVGKYAAPFLSGGNGTGFGNDNDPITKLAPPAGNQPNGPDATVYLTTGSTGASPGTQVEILLPGTDLYFYFGLLWGSVDAYNTLAFYNGATLIGSITGNDVTASSERRPGRERHALRQHHLHGRLQPHRRHLEPVRFRIRQHRLQPQQPLRGARARLARPPRRGAPWPRLRCPTPQRLSAAARNGWVRVVRERGGFAADPPRPSHP